MKRSTGAPSRIRNVVTRATGPSPASKCSATTLLRSLRSTGSKRSTHPSLRAGGTFRQGHVHDPCPRGPRWCTNGCHIGAFEPRWCTIGGLPPWDPGAVSPVDEYLEGLPHARRAPLEHVRSVVHESVPEVEEGRSYGMPAFRYRGRPLLAFAATRQHLGLYPCSGWVVDQVREELGDFSLSSGAVRFTEDHPVPDATLRRMVALRRQEIEEGRPA
ncbi:MAG: DUF1801 domain-containing protein [Candidatus Dormibacteraeota bacterium]|nr:DUF1801 domain-containing protein [Candidatus Dormibacteraeota bacterium]